MRRTQSAWLAVGILAAVVYCAWLVAPAGLATSGSHAEGSAGG